MSFQILPLKLTQISAFPSLDTKVDRQCHHSLCDIASTTDTMDKDSKFHKAAKAVQGRAVDWLQQKLQLPSQENHPSPLARPPTNVTTNESCSNDYEAPGTGGIPPRKFDGLKLRFEVSLSTLSLLSPLRSRPPFKARSCIWTTTIDPVLLCMPYSYDLRAFEITDRVLCACHGTVQSNMPASWPPCFLSYSLL